jgi:hypothetical protein
MSYLINGNFGGYLSGPRLDPWVVLNEANAVTFDLVNDPSVAKSTDFYLRFDTNTAGGSIAQDIQLRNVPSVTCLGWFRSGGPNPVSGILTIWTLGVQTSVGIRDFAVHTSFTVTQNWTLITNTRSLNPYGLRNVRIEIYHNTPNEDLLVDSINAF